MTIATTFALVNSYQNRENYAFTEQGDVDCDNPYWKYKGGSDVTIVDGLSVAEVMQLTTVGGLEVLVDVAAAEQCEPNGCYEYDFRDWNLYERGQAQLDAVVAYVGENQGTQFCSAYGVQFSAYAMGMSEECAKWAIALLKEQGVIVANEQWYDAPLSLA